jgi:hypothetical protein
MTRVERGRRAGQNRVKRRAPSLEGVRHRSLETTRGKGRTVSRSSPPGR